MKKLLLMTLLATISFLTGCEPYMFGIPQSQFYALTPTQQTEVIRGYNQQLALERQYAPTVVQNSNSASSSSSVVINTPAAAPAPTPTVPVAQPTAPKQENPPKVRPPQFHKPLHNPRIPSSEIRVRPKPTPTPETRPAPMPQPETETKPAAPAEPEAKPDGGSDKADEIPSS